MIIMLKSAGPVSVCARVTALVCALSLLSGCALVRRKAVGMVASTLASSGDVFTRDDDPELVGQAIPFGLKLYESLLDSAPKNKDLLYVGTEFGLYASLDGGKQVWRTDSTFSIIGFAPENMVYYSYNLKPAGTVYPLLGFTAEAVADLDQDGVLMTFWVNNLREEIYRSGPGLF